MDTYPGRRTSNGTWVAVGDVLALLRAQAAREVVEVETPSRHVARVRISGVGRPWLTPGGDSAVAYGYLEDAQEDAA